jgi:2-hydroxychromene-2-carboxylate isomerase
LLEQINSKQGLDWRAWTDPRFTSRDIPPHEAVKSVFDTQGQGAFERYHMALFRAYHRDKRDLANPLELLAIAREVEVDTTVLMEDLRTRKYKEVVGADHEEAREPWNIFGVPTILFDGKEPTFVKLAEGAWEGPDDLDLLQALSNIAATRPYMLEIKKPVSANLAATSAARNR